MSFFGRVGNLARGMWKTMGGSGPDDGREAALDEELRRDAGLPGSRSVARPGTREPTSPTREASRPGTPGSPAPGASRPGAAGDTPAPPEREPDGSVKRTL